MNKALAMLGGLAFGAGLTYWGDPDRGRRRRALLRGKAIRLTRVSREGLEVAGRDLSNRASGWVAEANARLRGGPVEDPVLLARVRAKLGRHCTHPHAVTVEARDGKVTLSGAILATEAGSLLDAIRRVSGVTSLVDRLERHAEADLPSLQGGNAPSSEELEWRQQYWTPATRLLAGVGGGALLAWGLARRGALGVGVGLGGIGLLARAIANRSLSDMLGVGVAGAGFTIQKTMTINAPIEQVYAFWSQPENFPRFMRHIREVRPLGEGRSHWVVSGPGGVVVEWDAVITRTLKNELISWKSVPGATVANTGTVHLQENPDGSTRVHLQMCYHPPAGMVGHAVATLFGADPKQSMDDDLARMKLLIQREAQLRPLAPEVL